MGSEPLLSPRMPLHLSPARGVDKNHRPFWRIVLMAAQTGTVSGVALFFDNPPHVFFAPGYGSPPTAQLGGLKMV